MGVIYNAAIKIGKVCSPKWYRFTPKPTITPSLSDKPIKTLQPSYSHTPSNTPSVSPSPTPTPSISYTLSSTPSSTPEPSQSLSRCPSNTPTPSATPPHSAVPTKPVKDGFWGLLLRLLKKLFSK